jgi:uncharacterized caspase-like protein
MPRVAYCRYLTLILSMLLLTLAFSAHAQGKKWALLIGIEEYDRAEISHLDFAVKDVNAIARALQQNLGYEAAHIRTMTSAIKDSNDSNRPTNDNVIGTLERLAKSVGPEDTFLFYFTGHGFTRDGQNFLASVNANPLSVNTLKRSAIPLADLQDTMKGFRAKQILFVIDACRNDPEKGKGEGDNKLTDDFSKSLTLAARSGQAGSSGVLFACSEGERAFEDPSKGQSVFTYYLMQALQGKAGGKGPLALADVMTYVRKQVGAWAEEHGKKQTPELLPKEADQLVLADNINVMDSSVAVAALPVSIEKPQLASNPAGSSEKVMLTHKGEAGAKSVYTFEEKIGTTITFAGEFTTRVVDAPTSGDMVMNFAWNIKTRNSTIYDDNHAGSSVLVSANGALVPKGKVDNVPEWLIGFPGHAVGLGEKWTTKNREFQVVGFEEVLGTATVKVRGIVIMYGIEHGYDKNKKTGTYFETEFRVYNAIAGEATLWFDRKTGDLVMEDWHRLFKREDATYELTKHMERISGNTANQTVK